MGDGSSKKASLGWFGLVGTGDVTLRFFVGKWEATLETRLVHRMWYFPQLGTPMMASFYWFAFGASLCGRTYPES